jgi:hypothetical protein
MRNLLITLFIIGNVLFLGQLARDLHHLVWGVETSVFDEFHPERIKARNERSSSVLLEEYRKAWAESETLRKEARPDKSDPFSSQDTPGSYTPPDTRAKNPALFKKLDELHTELTQREMKGRELRDTWAYSGYGILLILIGFMAYDRGRRWVGVALSLSGFTVLEYWASPPVFGGAQAEFTTLLWSKTALTVIALVLLYISARGIRRSDLGCR